MPGFSETPIPTTTQNKLLTCSWEMFLTFCIICKIKFLFIHCISSARSRRVHCSRGFVQAPPLPAGSSVRSGGHAGGGVSISSRPSVQGHGGNCSSAVQLRVSMGWRGCSGVWGAERGIVLLSHTLTHQHPTGANPHHHTCPHGQTRMQLDETDCRWVRLKQISIRLKVKKENK